MGYLGTGFSEWWIFWVLDFFGFRFNGLGIWDLVFIKSQFNRFLGQTIFRVLGFFLGGKLLVLRIVWVQV